MASSRDDDRFQSLEVQRDDINILLLGETGVGKSTFINAIANYLDYETFEQAEKQKKISCLVPAKFVVTDENFQQKTVSVGDNSNETTSIFESATQTTRSYVFHLDRYKRRLRLIDTPGIGDTRGIQYDADNLENILSYIGQMEYLHAICFLLKPNNSRLTVMFEYCIKQLLSRLEKSASRNIVFIFTNSRSTFYKPGDTTSAIMKILDGIRRNPPNVDIAFGKDNVFCLDNESFRYLVAMNNGITLGSKQSFAESWRHSAEECHRMIRYVIGEGGTLKMAPHRVRNTMSVNEARRIILQLSQPLAEIADMINDNINVLQRHTKALQQDNSSVESLRSKLYVPVVNLRQKELTQPVTVCTNVHCSEIYMVGERKKYHYKQRCHNPCYLRNVPKEFIGDPALKSCAAMSANGKCKECSCDFSSHMHIYYETETYEDKIHNEGVKGQITDRESAIEASQQQIKEIEQRVKEYEAEKATIVKSMAKFAHFLQHNAIAPYNDAYKAYILYLIDRENSLGSQCDRGTLKSLEELLKQYEQERQILEDALKMSESQGRLGKVTADSIFQTVKDLFNLKITGKSIKDMHTKQKSNQTKEFKDTEIVLKKKHLLVSDSDDDSGRSEVSNHENCRRGRGNRGRYNRSNGNRGNNRGFTHNIRGNDRNNTQFKHTNNPRRNNYGQNQQGNNHNFQRRGNQNNGNNFPNRPNNFNLLESPRNDLQEAKKTLPEDLFKYLRDFERDKIKQQYEQPQNYQRKNTNASFEQPKFYKESDNPFEELRISNRYLERNASRQDHRNRQPYDNTNFDFDRPKLDYDSRNEDYTVDKRRQMQDLMDKWDREKSKKQLNSHDEGSFEENPKKLNREELIEELLAKYDKKDNVDDMVRRQFDEMGLGSKRHEPKEDDVSDDFSRFLKSNGLEDLCKQDKYRRYYDDSDSDNEGKYKKGMFNTFKSIFK